MSDFDFDIDQTLKSARRSGNRRRKEVLEDDNLDDVLDSALATNNNIKQQQQQQQQNTRRSSRTKEDIQANLSNNKQSNSSSSGGPAVSGWGEDDLSSAAKSRNKQDDGFGANFQSNININNKRELNNTDEIDIPEIPDLEEQTDAAEDMAFQVAEAPDVQVHQISTYKELDKEFFREKAFQFLEGNIDVSLLHCGLNTENQIAEEEDVIWDWTKLFTEVVSSLTKENDNNVEDIFASGGTSATNESDAFKTKSELTSTTTTSTKRQRDTLLF